MMRSSRTGRRTPSFKGLIAASRSASSIARASSRKSGSRCELILRKYVRALGLRYSANTRAILGRPDLAFPSARVAVFCDGDFWHGRDLRKRLELLRRGHNAQYWTAKILTNVRRDRQITRQLKKAEWAVLRLWESDIHRFPEQAANQVAAVVRQRLGMLRL